MKTEVSEDEVGRTRRTGRGEIMELRLPETRLRGRVRKKGGD